MVAIKKWGLHRSPIYNVWINMRQRCVNPNKTVDYKRYGKRGISICKRWQSFDNFLADMGEIPTPKHTLDRKNNEQGYCKENCKWATRTEQANNRRSNHIIVFNNQSKTLAQWSLYTGIPYHTLKRRIYAKWTIEKAFTAPIGKQGQFKKKVHILAPSQ